MKAYENIRALNEAKKKLAGISEKMNFTIKTNDNTVIWEKLSDA